MFTSNVGNPLVLQNASMKQVADGIANMLHDDALCPWFRVTNADPTPTFLRAFASTLNPASSYSTNPYFMLDNSIMMYDTSDPGLQEASPYCRIMVIGGWRYACQAFIMDTRHATPSYADADKLRWSSAGGYNFIQAQTLTGFSNTSNYPFWLGYSHQSTGIISGVSYTYVCHDNFLSVMSITDGFTTAGFNLWYPNELDEADGYRAHYPLFFGFDFTGNTQGNGAGTIGLNHPSFANAPNGGNRFNKMYEIHPLMTRDILERVYMQKVGVYNATFTPNFYAYCPYLFSVPSSLVLYNQQITLNGNEYLGVGKFYDMNVTMVAPLFDLNP